MSENYEKQSQKSSQATTPNLNPCDVYPEVKGINCMDFQLSPDGLLPDKRKKALNQLQDYESMKKECFLGYQANQKLDYENDLKQYLNFHINNLGDPFQSGNFKLNSKFMERAVLDYFANLWNASWPHLPPELPDRARIPYEERKDSYWGYVVSMGCTEGNVYGLWNGRDYLGAKFLLEDPQAEHVARRASIEGRPAPVQRRLIYYQAETPKENPNAHTPVAFYSQDTHYSIVKAVRVLNIQTFYEIGTDKDHGFPCPLKYPEDYPQDFSKHYIDAKHGNWPLEVPSDEDGSIYIPALVKLVDCFAEKGYPILVCFNYGTTFKGAYDNVKAAAEQLVPVLKKHNMYERKVCYDPDDKTKFDKRNGFWFHVDGALGAAYMPFVEMAINEGDIVTSDDYEFPVFDFRIKDIHSIAMSGHKWIGAPWPCGIYMTKVKYQLQPPDDPMYLGSLDSTFAGSRNGFSAMILWDYLSKNSYKALEVKAKTTEENAQYAFDELKRLQERLNENLWIERSPLSLTIRFKQANEDIVDKYSLSGEDLYVKGQKRSYSHIFIMEHVDKQLIGRLIKSLGEPGAFPEQKDEEETVPEHLTSQNAKRLVHVPHRGRGFK